MKRIKKNIGAVLLILVVFVLGLANYEYGTWLSGWDTLHPEFNFGLYFKRIFFGVWQEHQGLGAVAAQAHAAELPRMLIYYPLSFILSLSYLRYSYFFLALIIGPLGVYFFLKKKVLKNLVHINREVASFSGGLFYLLNLATLQHFYLPLEMFATHFATLPWLFLLAADYIKNRSKRTLAGLVAVTFFAAPVAHTATLFYAYFFGLAIFVCFLSYLSKKNSFKRAILILVLTLAVNGFWLLPNIYFILNHGKDVYYSKIHSMFSQKAFLTGKQFGNIKDIAIFKNFLFDWGEFDEAKGYFIDLFDEWKPHLNKPYVLGLGYISFILVLLGICISIKDKKEQGLALLPIFLLAFFFLANNNVLAELFYSFAAGVSPILKEALRFPFTKFSVFFIFAGVCYFAFSIGNISLRLRKKSKKLPFFLAAVVAFLSFFYMLPAFSGNLISPTMRTKIPKEYFDLFAWFSKQDKNSRIAHFPVHTFWGWVYYRWGYEGAGFLWFGLPQPLLDREFDRWMPQNENYYWEVSKAVYSGNLILLENVLEKYQVQWILLDKNIISPSSNRETYYERLEWMLGNSQKIMLTKQFGKILIYKVNLVGRVDNFIYLKEGLPEVNKYKWGDFDRAYMEFGDYVSEAQSSKLKAQGKKQIYYPFRSLFSGRGYKDLEFEIEDRGDYFVFEAQIDKELVGGSLIIPPIVQDEFAEVDIDDLGKQKVKLPKVFLDGELIGLRSSKADLLYIKQGKLEVWLPKIYGYYSFDNYYIDPYSDKKVDISRRRSPIEYTNLFDSQEEQDSQKKSYNLYWLKNSIGYLISVQSRNIKGQPLTFSIENLTAKRSDQIVLLSKTKDLHWEYFIQPPMQKDAIGYALHFDNESIGNEERINKLGRVTLNPIPYRFLTGIKLVKGSSTLGDSLRETSDVFTRKTLSLSDNGILQVEHTNPSMYEVKLSNRSIYQSINRSTLVLSQAYDRGWKAYSIKCKVQSAKCKIKYYLPFVFGKKIGEHVLVNNWANGWRLNISTDQLTKGSIIIVYLPQYLQYFGFLLLFTVPAIILQIKK